MDWTANLPLNIYRRFASIITIECWTHTDSWSAVLLDCWDSGWVVGELDLYTATFRDQMFCGEFDKNFNIFLTDIQIILITHYLNAEGTDGSPNLKPSVIGSNSVGDSLLPSATHEGVSLEVCINSGDRQW